MRITVIKLAKWGSNGGKMGKSRICRKISGFFAFWFFYPKSRFLPKWLMYKTPLVSVAIWNRKKWSNLKKVVSLKNPLNMVLWSNYHDFKTLAWQKIPIISTVCNCFILALQDVENEDVKPADPPNPAKYLILAVKVDGSQVEIRKKVIIFIICYPCCFTFLYDGFYI